MSDTKLADSPTKHCAITVTKLDDGSYEATYEPKTITVSDSDTILSFKLKTAPDDVIITSVSINPEAQDQLSTPSVSKNGKQVTLSDVNTQRQKFNLNFVFGSKKGQRLAVSAARAALLGPYPEVENDPP